MFVRSSTYRKALEEAKRHNLVAAHFAKKYTDLLNEWNALVRKINRGDYVPRGARPQSPATFTPDEIDRLVRLCHPDRHGGSQAANEMTARLLQLRDAERANN